MFMKKSMAAYIQCLLNSSVKIKQKKSEEATTKIKSDYELFEQIFGEHMTKKSMRGSLEVIGDIKNFFESSSDFLIVYIENMRKLHGPSFNIATVKALLNLRMDMSAKEKAVVFSECKEILANYSSTDKGKTDGIFNNINTQTAAAEFVAEMTATPEGEGDPEVDQKLIEGIDDDDDELDLDSFLKDGGIDLEGLDEKQIEEAKMAKKKRDKNRDKVVDIKGDVNNKGQLF